MLFYPKSVKMKGGNTVKLSYSSFDKINANTDENILPLKYAKIAYNFKIEDGSLKDGYSLYDTVIIPYAAQSAGRAPVIPEECTKIEKVWHYKYFNKTTYARDAKLIILCSKGYLYYLNIDSHQQEFVKFYEGIATDSVAINYNFKGEDILLITSPTGQMGYVNGNCEYVKVDVTENQPDIVDMVIHYERLFAISKKNPKRLYFSDDLDPTNWNISLSEAGFIDFNDELGDLKKVFSFNDYLYILREFGISKLSAYGDQQEFYATHCYSSSSRIFTSSACICGDRIMFLTRDGIYSFNGITATKIELNIEKKISESNDEACAMYYEGKYHVACFIYFEDGKSIHSEIGNKSVNNAIISLDFRKGTFDITRGVDVISMLPADLEVFKTNICLERNKRKRLCCLVSSRGCFFGVNSIKRWYSPFTDLGYADKRKRIKEIYLKTKYDCFIYINTENTTKKYKVKGKNNISKVQVDVVGTLISIDFESTEKFADISNPQIIFELLG